MFRLTRHKQYVIYLNLLIISDFILITSVNARYYVVNGWTPADHRTPVDIMVDVTNNIGLLVLEVGFSSLHIIYLI